MKNKILQLSGTAGLAKRLGTTLFLIIILIAVGSFHIESDSKIIREVDLSAEELRLYDLLMDYRSGNDLKKIPLSKSLTFVAQTHVYDLTENHPITKKCNQHSWSGKGKWQECCYTDNHKRAACMWSKPKELTSYRGEGFEIAGFASENIDASTALSLWKRSKGHSQVILNQGGWANKNWNAIGIGIKGNYAVVWFGEEPDQEGEPQK